MTRPPQPVYTGVRKHIHPTAGFSLRIPSDWTAFPMAEGHDGFLFGPYRHTLDTVLLAEVHALPFTVTAQDASTLREGFSAGLQALPEIEIEVQDESVSDVITMFEARFTFREDGVRRKRWVRAIYAGTRQLLLVAQGRTPDEFDYWLPMFFNIMHTCELWPAAV